MKEEHITLPFSEVKDDDNVFILSNIIVKKANTF